MVKKVIVLLIALSMTAGAAEVGGAASLYKDAKYPIRSWTLDVHPGYNSPPFRG